MKRRLLFPLLLLGICAIFFYKSFLFFQIPFPGDLLINENPYRAQSFLGYAPGGYPNKAQDQDVITELMPWKSFVISELKLGRIPFWNPHNFSGNPIMSNFQSAVFYPLNILFFILPFSTSWFFFIFLQPVLASFFMYRFLKDLKLHSFACLIGSIAFAFSSYMSVWMEYGNIAATICWLPLVLFAIRRFIERKTVSYFLLSILAISLSILAGYIQGVFYIYILAFTYLVSIIVSKKIKLTPILCTSIVVIFVSPLLLALYQLLPTLSFFSQSTRNPYTFSQITNLLQPWYYIATLFSADFFGNPATRNFWLPITYIERVMYVGIPVLFFALIGIFSVKSFEKKVFTILGIVSLILSFNIPLVPFFYNLPIPVLSTTVPTRGLSIFIFCMIVIASFGINYWINEKKSPKKIIPIIFASCYLILWIVVFSIPKIYPLLSENIHVTSHNLILSTIIAFITLLIYILRRKIGKISFILLLVIVIFDLFYFFEKITPFAPSAILYPSTDVISYIQKNAGIYRYWGYGAGYVPANFSTFDGTYSPEGNDPLHIKDYGQLLESSKNGVLSNSLPRPDANIASGFGQDDLRENTYRQTLLNLLGVKYILHNIGDRKDPDYGTFPEKIYTMVWQQNPWQLFENKKVLPRYFLTSGFVKASNQKNAIDLLYNKIDLSKQLILYETPPNLDPESSGIAALTSYEPNKVVFHTKTTRNTLLFLSDTFDSSWKGSIDMNPTKIYQADFAFRAIGVPMGEHTVTMYYSSASFSLGLILATVSLILLIVYTGILYRYGKAI